MTGSFPRWCAPDCEHASFPDEKALDGACHTFIALYCAKYGRLVNKSALCLDAQGGRRRNGQDGAENGLPGTLDGPARACVEDILRLVLESGRQAAYEHEAYEILRLAGIETPVTRFFSDISAIARFDADAFPGDVVICKIISPEMPHRSEHGGVRRSACSVSALEETFASFEKITAGLGVKMSGMMIAELFDIDENVPRQLLITLRRDPSFGPVVIAGIGGTGTEVWGSALKPERSLFISSVRDIAGADLIPPGIDDTLFYPVVTGGTRITRSPMVGPEVLASFLNKIALLGSVFSDSPGEGSPVIEELEINPVQITGEGRLVALDALMKISTGAETRPPAPGSCIENMLNPSSVLVIGASAGRRNMGRIILGNLLSAGRLKKEDIFVIHPDADEIDGCRAFRSPAEIPGGADMTVFTIPASESSVSLLEELISGGYTRSIVLISGGFGEIEGGRHLSLRLSSALAAKRASGAACPVVNGPNCMGIYSGPGGINTFFLPDYKLPFRGVLGAGTAVISQSGAWLVTLLSTLGPEYTPKHMITVGNQIDLTVTDHLLHLSGDADVKLFVIYIEGFVEGDGARFLDAARDIIASGRRILVYKTGRTAAGAAAAASHTAAMATDHDLFTQLVAKAGIYEADTLQDMEDAVRMCTLLRDRRPRGRRIAICSDAGFECSVAADRLYSLELSVFTPRTVEALAGHLPGGIIDVHNPVDTTPAVTTAQYGHVVEAVLADRNTDIALISNVAATATQENLVAGPGHDEDITREGSHPNTLIRLFEATDIPMAVCLNEGSIYDGAAAMMEAAGIPVFRKIDRAMKAMDTFVRLCLG